MFFNFFRKCCGKRRQVKPTTVQLCAWHDPTYNPTHHLGLRIEIEEKEHYISFHPTNLAGLSTRPCPKLPKGIPGFFINSYDDERLVDGFKKLWPYIPFELNTEDRAEIKTHKITKVSHFRILEMIKAAHPTEAQCQILRNHGMPKEMIQFDSLDTAAMIKKMDECRSLKPPMVWASWAGSFLHQRNTHNCASIILKILYEGGMGAYLTPSRDLLSLAGALLGLGYALFYRSPLFEDFIDFAIGLGIGRAVGGLHEGYEEIQPLLDIMASQKKDNLCAMWGLRLLNASFSSLVGMLKIGPITPAFLTLPRHVLSLAHEAKQNEAAVTSAAITSMNNQLHENQRPLLA